MRICEKKSDVTPFVIVNIIYKNPSPNTNDLYIHNMDKSTGTPPSLEEKRALPNCGNKEIHVLKKCIYTSATVLKYFEITVPICSHTSLVFGDEFLAQGLHLRHTRGLIPLKLIC